MIAILLAPVYLLANYYLLRRVMGWVKAWFPFFRTARHWALPVAVQAFLACSIVIAFFLPEGRARRVMKLIGNYWLGVLLYVLLAVIAADLLRLLLGYVLPFKHIFVTTQMHRIAGCVCALLILIASIWGVVNARIIHVTPYDVTVDKTVEGMDEMKVVLVADLHLGYNIGEKQMQQKAFTIWMSGLSGAGKSTIIKNLIKEMSPIGGNIYIKGREISDYTSKEYAKTMSVVLTEKIKTEMMTCRDVVAMGRYPYTNYFGRLTNEDEQIVNESLKKVSALDIADNDFSQISDGQRQRIMLARAICQKPEVIVLDEPTSFLDIRHKIELLDILQEMAVKDNVAVIVSLHEIELAAKIADYVMCVGADRKIEFGRPERKNLSSSCFSAKSLTLALNCSSL